MNVTGKAFRPTHPLRDDRSHPETYPIGIVTGEYPLSITLLRCASEGSKLPPNRMFGHRTRANGLRVRQKHNLPPAVESFVGREQELSDITRSWQTAACLTDGPGGVERPGCSRATQKRLRFSDVLALIATVVELDA